MRKSDQQRHRARTSRRRGARIAPQIAPARLASLPPHRSLNHLWRWARNLAGGVLLVAGTIFAFAQAVGTPWPTSPDVSVSDIGPSPPTIFRFAIKNRSVLFDMTNVNLECVIVHFNSPVPPLTKFDNNSFEVAQGVSVPSGGLLNQYCPWQRMMQLNGGEMPVNEITVAVDISYYIAGFWHRSYRSVPFTWEKKTGRWIVGPIVGR
jgi:hypothetical protein